MLCMDFSSPLIGGLTNEGLQILSIGGPNVICTGHYVIQSMNLLTRGGRGRCRTPDQ